MTVAEYNETVAIIRRDAGLLLDVVSRVHAVLTACGLPVAAVAKLPPILEGETETRLRELVGRAPIELGRDAGFVHQAEDAIAGLCAAWEACVKAAKVWDDLVAAGHVQMFDFHGNPIRQTAYEKALEAQRAKSRLRLVKDDE
jgi:hypothetical protein